MYVLLPRSSTDCVSDQVGLANNTEVRCMLILSGGYVLALSTWIQITL